MSKTTQTEKQGIEPSAFDHISDPNCATQLPYEDESIDVCLLPELLELRSSNSYPIPVDRTGT